ncbi:hypothetical protein COCCADRAFT_25516 [Bipolaris zeicola 26-R-13]|uniref:Fungal N-terminal domain-containing protein n=1 Tax=Cochliobolus carbonum (strain 26-R-13) TaxID=930089 RepID=W6Y3R9_COCC2|nr:uncharacterized protein COCCADRAFT_25516 [Bipolaris zeicola 26-R-13]EUC34327.1 hypothetical protein COCCADRAFT_25516 [Bipolaris zeicola 26-R-13]
MSKVDRLKIAIFCQRKIDAFRGQLDNYKATLQLALTTVVIYARLSNPAFTPDTISEKAKQLEKHEKDIGKKIVVTKGVETNIEEKIRQLNIASDIASNDSGQVQQEPFPASVDDESKEEMKELISELQHLKSSSQAYCQLSEEALSKTMSERTGTNVSIRGVTVKEQGLAISGVISETGEELKIQLDISDVTVRDQGIAVSVVADKLDLSAILAACNEGVRLHAGDKKPIESNGHILGRQATADNAGVAEVQSPAEQVRTNRILRFS